MPVNVLRTPEEEIFWKRSNERTREEYPDVARVDYLNRSKSPNVRIESQSSSLSAALQVPRCSVRSP